MWVGGPDLKRFCVQLIKLYANVCNIDSCCLSFLKNKDEHFLKVFICTTAAPSSCSYFKFWHSWASWAASEGERVNSKKLLQNFSSSLVPHYLQSQIKHHTRNHQLCAQICWLPASWETYLVTKLSAQNVSELGCKDELATGVSLYLFGSTCRCMVLDNAFIDK